jgi:hypothetical protein
MVEWVAVALAFAVVPCDATPRQAHSVLADMRRRAMVAIGVAGVLLGVGAGGYWFLLGQELFAASGDLPRVVEEYRKRGLPWVAGDLERGSADAREGARPGLKAALDLLPSGRSASDLLRHLPYAHADPALVLREFDSFSPAMERAILAAGLPRSPRGSDSDRTLFVDNVPELFSMREFSKLLAFRSEVLAAAGDAAGAARDLQAARRIAHHVSASPSVLASLVELAMSRIALHAAVNVLDSFRGDAAGLKAILSMLEEEYPLDIARALEGEMYHALATARNDAILPQLLEEAIPVLRESPPPTQAVEPVREGLPKSKSGRAWLARHLECYMTAHHLAARHPDDPLRLAQFFDDQLDRMETSRRWTDRLLAVSASPMPQFLESAAEERAKLVATRELARALLFEANHGRFPSLHEMGDLAIDPFTGTSLKYLSSEGSVRVYSVGRNRADDGGIAGETLGEGDIVSHYPAPRRNTS